MAYLLSQREEWEVPHGALDVAIPRKPARILLQTVLTISYAICIYFYLNDLSPRTRRKSWMQLAIQAVFFLNLPEFLPVQMMSGFLGMAIEQFGPSRSSSFRRFADIASLGRFRSKHHIQAVASSPMYKAGCLLPMIQGCLLGLDAYISRFSISYHVATDVGNLGFDHRNGWISAAGLLAGLLAILYRFVVWIKRCKSQGKEAEIALTNLLSGGQTREESDKADSDRSTGLQWFGLSLETQIVLIEGFFASAIHQYPLAATHRKTQLFDLTGPATLVVVILTMAAMRQSRPSIAIKVQLLLGVIAFGFAGLTIVESLVIDFDELYAANAGIVFPYNYRWQVTDRIDRLLRLIL